MKPTKPLNEKMVERINKTVTKLEEKLADRKDFNAFFTDVFKEAQNLKNLNSTINTCLESKSE